MDFCVSGGVTYIETSKIGSLTTSIATLEVGTILGLTEKENRPSLGLRDTG